MTVGQLEKVSVGAGGRLDLLQGKRVHKGEFTENVSI